MSSDGAGYRLTGQIFTGIIVLVCVVLVVATVIYIVELIFGQGNTKIKKSDD